MTVNLGPVNSSGSLPGFIGDGTGFDYNPRCLVRDIASSYSRPNFNTQQVVHDIVQAADFDGFTKNAIGYPGLHSTGHFTVGGVKGVMTDEFISPADPVFYFHHGQLDRVWAIWQNQDLPIRQNQLTGYVNWYNSKLNLSLF